MKLSTKIYLKSINFFHSYWRRLKGNKGWLDHIEDENDKKWLFEDGKEMKDFKMGSSLPEIISHLKYFFNQLFLNICVFASGTLGFSEQNKIRFSVKWMVKNAVRLGYVSGNGFSYLRAMAKIGTKVGFLPYEYMPDEITGSWSDYSRWTKEDEELLKVAEKYKSGDYRWVTTEDGLIGALANGYVPLTGGKWFSDMNKPKSPLFLLRYLGSYVGGHAYRNAGYRNFGQHKEVPQTFGKEYGDNSKAWIESLWHRTFQSGIFVFQTLPLSTRVEHFKGFYEGKMVRTKGDIACYFIHKGKKRWVISIDVFQHIIDQIGYENFDADVKQDTLDAIEKGDDILHFPE